MDIRHGNPWKHREMDTHARKPEGDRAAGPAEISRAAGLIVPMTTTVSIAPCPMCDARSVEIREQSPTNVQYLCVRCGYRWVMRRIR